MNADTKVLEAIRTAMRFQYEVNAINFVNRATMRFCIVLGDDMRYWVVTNADGQRLERAGYEIL